MLDGNGDRIICSELECGNLSMPSNKLCSSCFTRKYNRKWIGKKERRQNQEIGRTMKNERLNSIDRILARLEEFPPRDEVQVLYPQLRLEIDNLSYQLEGLIKRI